MAIKANPVKTIPTRSSKSEEWIAWHKALKQNFGRKQANILWVKAWSLRGTSSANTNDLREYLSKQGVVIDKSSWDSIVDSGADVGDFLGNFAKAGQIASIAIVAIIIGGSAMLIYNVVRQPVKSAQAAAGLRGMKGLK